MWSSSPPFNVFFVGGNPGPGGSDLRIGTKDDDEFSLIQNNLRRFGLLQGGALFINTTSDNNGQTKVTSGGGVTVGATTELLSFNMAPIIPLFPNLSGMILAQVSGADIPGTGVYGNFLLTCAWQRVADVITLTPTAVIYSSSSDPSIQAEIVVDANRARIQVTGFAGVDMYWSGIAITTHQRISS